MFNKKILSRSFQFYTTFSLFLQSLTNEGSPYNVFEVGESYLVFGTNLAKAGRLQQQRPFLFWHASLLEKVAAFLANYLGGIN